MNDMLRFNQYNGDYVSCCYLLSFPFFFFFMPGRTYSVPMLLFLFSSELSRVGKWYMAVASLSLYLNFRPAGHDILIPVPSGQCLINSKINLQWALWLPFLPRLVFWGTIWLFRPYLLSVGIRRENGLTWVRCDSRACKGHSIDLWLRFTHYIPIPVYYIGK